MAERTAEFTRANAKLLQEIEEHRKTEDGMALRASILDSTGEPIFLINSRGNFVYVNKTAARSYGFSQSEFLEMNLSQLLRPGEEPPIPGRLQELLKQGQLDSETIHLRKDKSQMPVKVRYSPMETAHGTFFVSVVRELTTNPPPE